MVAETNDSGFEQEVLKADKAIVDFWAEWCGPCRMIGPSLEELSNEMTTIKFFKMNVDQNQQTPAKYGIRSIPTLLLFAKGELKGQIIGALPKDSLKQKIEQVFA
ncbi:thioredoxin [Candidatus Woesearchaeota archaeon]|nr:thioredoxin [Candidatus Woesearchaeota archaeon]